MTVDLALGPRWWLLPLAVLLPMAFNELLDRVDVFGFLYQPFASKGYGKNGHSALTYPTRLPSEADFRSLCTGFALAAVPLVAAVLLLYESSPTRVLAALALVAAAGWALESGSTSLTFILGFTLLTCAQLVAMMTIGSLRWRTPLPSSWLRGWSISSLMLITTAVAVIVSMGILATQTGTFSNPKFLNAAAMVLGCSCLGQVIGRIGGRRIALAGGCAGVVIFLALLEFGPRNWPPGNDWWVHASRSVSDALAAMAAFLAGWAICYLHRCDPRQAVPTVTI